MERYVFCPKGSREKVSFCLASCYRSAVRFFSENKKLSEDSFLEIYVVRREINERGER